MASPSKQFSFKIFFLLIFMCVLLCVHEWVQMPMNTESRRYIKFPEAGVRRSLSQWVWGLSAEPKSYTRAACTLNIGAFSLVQYWVLRNTESLQMGRIRALVIQPFSFPPLLHSFSAICMHILLPVLLGKIQSSIILEMIDVLPELLMHGGAFP